MDNNSINNFDQLGLCSCKQKPGYTPKPNGCGPESPKLLNTLVPEGFFPSLGGYNFTPACNIHDICWGTCCKNKATCDKQFHNNLKLACDQWVDRIYGPGGF